MQEHACRERGQLTCTGNSWRAGGVAIGNEALTSFDFADEILRKLARKDVFPNLKVIVFSGHSAGGQFVSRYELANQVHEKLGVPVTYVVANPSSYAWPDANRPVAGRPEFRPYSDSACAYDRWPYGWQQRAGYSARVADDQLMKQLISRGQYMVGELDTLPIAGFDSTCPAMAQGPNRLRPARRRTGYIKGASRRAARVHHDTGARAQRPLHVHGRSRAADTVSPTVTLIRGAEQQNGT